MMRNALRLIAATVPVLLLLAGCSEKEINPFDPAQDPDPPIVTSFTLDGGVATWWTDEEALCVLEYRTQGGEYDHYVYESTKQHTRFHEVTILAMDAGELYDFRVRSWDRAGNVGYGTSDAFPLAVAGESYDGETMSLGMIDVGWGLSMLVTTPNGANILIDSGQGDGGDYPHLDALLSYLFGHDASYLDVAVLTHHHSDHYGGYWEEGGVLDMLLVESFIITDPEQTFAAMNDSLARKINKYGIPLSHVRMGDTSADNPALQWDPHAAFDVKVLGAGLGYRYAPSFANPDEEESMLTNNDSMVLKITFGGVSFITSADAEYYAEYEMISDHGAQALRADLVQVAHHANDDATSELWLEVVDPRIGLVSNWMIEATLEKESTLQNLRAAEVDYFITDRVFPNTPRDAEPVYGNIIAITDGRTIEIVLEIHEW